MFLLCKKLIRSTAFISILLLPLTIQGCFWNPPELSLAEAGAEGEGGESETEFEYEPEGEGEGGEEEGGEGEGGEAKAEFESAAEGEGEGGEREGSEREGSERERGEREGGEAKAEFESAAEGEGGELVSASRGEAEVVTASAPLRGHYSLEFTKTTGQNECAQFGEVLDLKVSAEGLMTGYLYYSGSRGGPFSGRVRSDGTWSAISPDEGYKFEGNIRDEEVSGEYTAPAPNPTEGEGRCEGTVEGFKTPD